MGIELIVFDLAGTTVKDNKDVHRVLKSALAKHGVDISIDDANAVMGIPKPTAIRELLQKRGGDRRLITDERIDRIHKDFVRDMIDFYRTDEAVGEKGGVSELFRKLKDRKLKVYVDTGFDRPITNALLDRMGWHKEKLIDGSVTSDEVNHGRPYPDMIYRAMQLCGIEDPQRVAKVGDTASDLQEGTAAGCGLVIGVTDGAFTREMLQQEIHTHLVDRVTDVISILHKAS
jgi:phosphonatase-like hydrolase